MAWKISLKRQSIIPCSVYHICFADASHTVLCVVCCLFRWNSGTLTKRVFSSSDVILVSSLSDRHYIFSKYFSMIFSRLDASLFAFPPFFIVFSCSTYLVYFLKWYFIFISPSRYVDGLRKDVASLVQRPQVGMLYRRASATRSSVWVLVITSRGEAHCVAGCSWFFATHTQCG